MRSPARSAGTSHTAGRQRPSNQKGCERPEAKIDGSWGSMSGSFSSRCSAPPPDPDLRHKGVDKHAPLREDEETARKNEEYWLEPLAKRG